MSNFFVKPARLAMAVGTLIGLGSCSVDLATCPGDVEVENEGYDVKTIVVRCDENPDDDGAFDWPGTAWQKTMWAGLGVAGAGLILQIRTTDREDDALSSAQANQN